MADIINAAVQVKELQKEHQASIDNLRQQYFQMSEAADKHKFLQENQYIKYDLLELEELSRVERCHQILVDIKLNF
jgi:hypothetical protein